VGNDRGKRENEGRRQKMPLRKKKRSGKRGTALGRTREWPAVKLQGEKGGERKGKNNTAPEENSKADAIKTPKRWGKPTGEKKGEKVRDV